MLAMAVPMYDELLARHGVEASAMVVSFDDQHLKEFSFTVDKWEFLAMSLGISDPDVESIKRQGNFEEQRTRMLKCWKQRCGSKATYEAMTRALLQIHRTDLAEKVVSLRKQSSRNGLYYPTEVTKPSQPSRLNAAMAPRHSLALPGNHLVSVEGVATMSMLTTQSPIARDVLVPTMRELEEEFYELVAYIETMLENSQVHMNVITRRFSMLPQSVRRWHQMDENYTETRHKILSSRTIKELFDNLTALKHWSFMMPDTLVHILKDVRIDDIHQKIDRYQEKLLIFKTNTKLRDVINTHFPVPDYCIELNVEVEGWGDETIDQVERSVTNLLRRATYEGQDVRLGWKRAIPGSIKLTFILLEPVSIKSEMLPDVCRDIGVMKVQLDGDNLYKAEVVVKVSGDLWYRTNRIRYSVGGGRDVLIISSDRPTTHREAVARKRHLLSWEDKQKLLSQGVFLESQDELAIVTARYKLDKKKTLVAIKSGPHLKREDVMKSIEHHLMTTQNDGAVIYYIGAGKRNTGDWCFKDGFITFRDIARIYLRATYNFKGRVLTIVSDCSYSGRWVRDCMEFLDEQGVQPCGHKAREKGILVKMLASCKPNEVATEYQYSVNGAINERSGEMSFLIAKQLMEAQTTCSIDSSHIRCSNKTVDEPCTLPPDSTWRQLRVHIET